MNGGEIRAGHMFAGIGGFPLGLEKANSGMGRNRETNLCIPERQETQHSARDINPQTQRPNGCFGYKTHSFRNVWANEIDKSACQIYRKNLKDHAVIEGDIKEIDPASIPDIDILTGGFPCQPFSMAGKREGFQDIRGTLFFEIMRIAQAKRPKILFLENVKGLLSHDNGDTFETILRTLGNSGYWWEYKVLNSRYFGVPQNRERVFIIGHLRGAGTRQVFPFANNGSEDYEVGEVIGTLTGGGHSGGLHSNMTAILADNLGGNIKQRERDASLNPAWCLGGSTTLVSHSVRSGDRGSLDRHSWDIVEQNKSIRRLTPTECERLQGFPDGWTAGVSDTQRYKCLGNAVTVPVIQAIGELILEALD